MSDLSSALEARMQRLEDIEAIKVLKARYCNACDSQDAAGAKRCFAEGPVHIDMGHVGVFEHRDEFAALYEATGCHDYVLDMHQVTNPEIEIVDRENAKALWSLEYRNINTKDKSVTFITAMYHDEYRKDTEGWKIIKSVSEFKSALHCSYKDGPLSTLLAAKSVAGAVDYLSAES